MEEKKGKKKGRNGGAIVRNRVEMGTKAMEGEVNGSKANRCTR